MFLRTFALGVCACVFPLLPVSSASAQVKPRTPPQFVPKNSKESSADEAAENVVIRRESMRIVNPSDYQVPLELRAGRRMDVAAEVDGVVLLVQVKEGERVPAQTQLAQLRDTRQQKVLKRAQANRRIAELEKQQADASDDPVAAKLAAARLDAAIAEVDLANLELEAAKVRAPFDGTVLKTHVTPGRFVTAGTPLVTLVDTKTLEAVVPVDRNTVKVGEAMEIKVESDNVVGKVTRIGALPKPLSRLRDLAESVAAATVSIDNADGEYQIGQAVYSPLIPRQPVAEIPTLSLMNTGDGKRKVQIVRDRVVRDVVIGELGQVGGQRIHVAGSFEKGDELIIATSQQLADGTRLLPVVEDPAKSPGQTPDRPRQGRATDF